VTLSTHEIINGLEGFLLNEINYDVDKLYMISDQHFDSKINKKIFKFKKKVLLNKEVENLIKKCSMHNTKNKSARNPIDSGF